MTIHADDLREALVTWLDESDGITVGIPSELCGALITALTPRERRSWRCFHCDELFTTPGEAEDHFGSTLAAEPGCVIDKVAVEEGGKPQRGRGLLMALRKAEAELASYRAEDTELHRTLHRMDSDHRQALIREEEKGYRRGLADGHRHPEDAAAAARGME